jgi:hypothetical protein
VAVLDLTENDIQRAVFAHLRARGAPGVFAFHPKNGGVHQAGRRRGINSGLGVVSGVPDVIILQRGHIYGLELKREKGKVSDEQKEAMRRMEEAGALCGVAYGLDAALLWLEMHGLLRTSSRSTYSDQQAPQASP